MVSVNYNKLVIQSNLIGSYNFTNIAAAIAIGDYFKIAFQKIKTAIESYIPTNNRSQIIHKDQTTIILDAYNANPSSMNAAIENFQHIKYDLKTIFLGDMFELGATARIEHQKIVDIITKTSFDTVFLIGENFFNTVNKDTRISLYKSFEDLKNKESLSNISGAILIKGSRGMKLERILDLI